MEDTAPVINVYRCNRKRTLVDGTVVEYTYNRKYVRKSNRLVCGKAKMHTALAACKDREKVEQIKAVMIELGVMPAEDQ